MTGRRSRSSDSRRSPSTPGSHPIPPPARSSRPSSRHPPSASRASVSTKATSTAAPAIRPGPPSRPAWPPWKAATYGRAFSSGMSAEDAVLRLLSPGDHVLIGNDVYGGTYRLLSQVHALAGLEFDPVSLRRSCRVSRPPGDPPRAWSGWRSPSNPMLHIADIAALAELAHAPTAPCWSSTTRSPRRTSNNRSPWGPTSSCTRPPSTWAATATWSEDSSPRQTTR